MALVYFLLLLGPLVFFHELGHFLAAKRLGVKCEEFAIGIGPSVATLRRGETLFSFRALPLGGYVSMLGMHPGEEERLPSDRGRALTDKTPFQRAIIFLAGPAMNLLVPIPIFFVLLLGTAGRTPPTVGSVMADSPAEAAGLLPGDEIVSIDGDPVRYFDQLSSRARDAVGRTLRVGFLREGELHEVSVVPEAVTVRAGEFGFGTREIGRLGVVSPQYGSVVHVRSADSPAWAAGLRSFDRIVSVDGQAVRTWLDVERALREASTPPSLGVLRPEPTGDRFAQLYLDTARSVRLAACPCDAESLGLVDARTSVFGVQPGSPAERAGLRRGDRLLSVDGRAYSELEPVLERIYAEPARSWTLVVEREGRQLAPIVLQPEVRTVLGEFRDERDEVFIGLTGRRVLEYPEDRPMSIGGRLAYAFTGAFRETFGLIASILAGLWFLLAGEVDPGSIGGPLMIADIAARAGNAGWSAFVRMIALISVNLGILNLVPIPGLDGGQLAVVTFEALKRGPLSLRARQAINYVGIAMIVLLMLFAFKNDIERYWVDVANWLNS